MMRSRFFSLEAALLIGTLGLSLQTARAQEAEEEADKKTTSWTDDFTVGAFVDSYVALRSDNNSARINQGNGTLAGYPHEAYVEGSGFGLAFAGMDLNYSGEKFGATLSLRYGPGVVRFFGNKSDFGIANLTQAYATWKPTDKLTLDMGQFGTLYGAEVAESWRNQNYSRGALYYLMQPFWHTGLRANYAFNDFFQLNGMVVNGVNTTFEGNKSPTVGIQAAVTPTDSLFFAVGYMGALNPRNGDEVVGPSFDHFFDLVSTVSFGDFTVIGNFDFNLYDSGTKNENWWGVSVAPGYAFTNWLGAAARVEYLSDSANALFGTINKNTGALKDKGSMVTLTGTLDFKPIPNSGVVVLRPEFRWELTNGDYYLNRENNPTDKFWTIMMGAVVTSM